MRIVPVLSCVATAYAFPSTTLLLRSSRTAPSSETVLARAGDVLRRGRRNIPLFLQEKQLSLNNSRSRRCPTTWECKQNASVYMSQGSALATRGGGAPPKPEKAQSTYGRVASFLNKRFFLLGAVAMVASARLAPSIGATGGLLRPELTVDKAGEGNTRALAMYGDLLLENEWWRNDELSFSFSMHFVRMPTWPCLDVSTYDVVVIR